jgi:hypothetical protein
MSNVVHICIKKTYIISKFRDFYFNSFFLSLNVDRKKRKYMEGFRQLKKKKKKRPSNLYLSLKRFSECMAVLAFISKALGLKFLFSFC